MMRFLLQRFWPMLLAGITVIACNAEAQTPATGAPDISATAVAQARDVEAQVKATIVAIPTVAAVPAATPLPTQTPYPASTLSPTFTPYPTYTPFPTPTPVPLGENWKKYESDLGWKLINRLSDESTFKGELTQPVVLSVECTDEKLLDWGIARISGWGVTEMTAVSAWYSIDGATPTAVTLYTGLELQDWLIPGEDIGPSVADKILSGKESLVIGCEDFLMTWELAGLAEGADGWILPCQE